MQDKIQEVAAHEAGRQAAHYEKERTVPHLYEKLRTHWLAGYDEKPFKTNTDEEGEL